MNCINAFIQNKLCNVQLFEKKITIVDTVWKICSNSRNALLHFAELFYPDGANGISSYPGNDHSSDLFNLHISDKELKTIITHIHENWIASGECRPQWKGTYQVFSQSGITAYIQPQSDNSSTGHMILADTGRILIFSAEGEYDYKALTRTVREMAIRKLENTGYVIFHASAIELNGKGIIIIGNSGAGKSTLALCLCKYLKARFLANDRVVLKRNKNNSVTALAFSFPARLNYGTFKSLDWEMEHKKWNLRFSRPGDSSDWKKFNGVQKMHIMPLELQQELGLSLCSSMIVDRIIFPERVEDNHEACIHYSSKPSVLQDNCYSPDDPHFIEDWMNLRTLSEAEIASNASEIMELLCSRSNIHFHYTFSTYIQLIHELSAMLAY